MQGKSKLFEDVYEVVALIPSGRVTSYGAIARYLNITSARTVGWAMGALVGNPGIPAHRVVNSKGALSGASAFGSPNQMAEQLAHEGVATRDGQVVDFKLKFWDPSVEL
jgi:methylated-DNA-protein-cysteine methyltransferase-like protein